MDRNIGSQSDKINPYLLTVDDLDRLPDPTWQIAGILPQGSVALLYGEPGAGKSFVALDMALCIATARPWQGRTVAQGDVLYIAAEGGSALKHRVVAWRDRRGAKPSRAVFRAKPCDISNEGERSLLISEAHKAGWQPRAVVVDTLARCFGTGDENSTQAMNAFVAGLDHLREAFPDATILVVHHSGKDRSKRDRGNSALRGAADVVMRLEHKACVRVLSCEKAKDSEPFAAIALRLEQVRLPSGDTSCVVVAAGPHDADADDTRQPMRNKTDVLVFNALVCDGDVWRGSEGLTHGEWWKATGLPKSTFRHVPGRLIAAKRVAKAGERYVPMQ